MEDRPGRDAGDPRSPGPNDRADEQQALPIRITDDMHPWKEAWMLVVDHPFAAVTDEDGRYELSDVPPGTYELAVWNEKAGWLDKGRSVTVPREGSLDLPLEYDVQRFVE